MTKNIPPNYYKGVSPDLWARRVHRGFAEGSEQVSSPNEFGIGGDRESPPPYLGDAIYLRRGFLGRTVAVGSTPVQLIQSPYAYPYLILNPSFTLGLTSSFLIFSGNVTADGNTQASPVGVANYLNLHFHLIVTAIAGTWDIIAQTRDPITGLWADTQTIFNNITATGNYYAMIGAFGVVTDFAVRWVEVVAGNMTFSLSGSLKDGLSGSPAGFANTIFLGANSGVNTTSGYPLLEGQTLKFIVGENVEIWGVTSGPTIQAKIFEL